MYACIILMRTVVKILFPQLKFFWKRILSHQTHVFYVMCLGPVGVDYGPEQK